MPGAPSARTTAPTATRGPRSRTIRPARGPTAGARTGSAAICDDDQLLCLAFAFWNGRDPILKERIFGLTGHEGNHGEDVKEYWWYLDSTPTHSWMRWRYAYPQAEFPYADLVAENARRGRRVAGVRAAGHRRVRRGPLLGHHRRLRQGGARRPLHPHDDPQRGTRARRASTCFRRCGSATAGRGTPARPSRRSARRTARWWPITPTWAGSCLRETATPSRCSATTRATCSACGAATGRRIPRTGSTTTSSPARATVNPAATGTKAALRYQLEVDAGETAEIRLRLRARARDARATRGRSRCAREREADDFYASLAPARDAGRGAGDAPGVRRDAVEQAVLPLRRRPLAARRPDPTAAAAERADRDATRAGATSTTAT